MDKLWGLPIVIVDSLPPNVIILSNQELILSPDTKQRIPVMKNTVQIDVTTSIPVEVAQEALASRALELLKREVEKAAKRVVEDFISHGITASVEDLAIKAEKRATKFSGTGKS